MQEKNVTASKPKVGGSIYAAPRGTTLPVNASSALDEAFMELGYASEDGVTNTTDIDTESTYAWGGDKVLENQKSKTDNFKVTLIESLNINTLKVVYGSDNVTGNLATGITVKSNARELDYWSFVVDMVLKNNTLKRVVIPAAKPTSIGDITYNDTDPIGYELDLGAVADESGNTHYEYIQSEGE